MVLFFQDRPLAMAVAASQQVTHQPIYIKMDIVVMHHHPVHRSLIYQRRVWHRYVVGSDRHASQAVHTMMVNDMIVHHNQHQVHTIQAHKCSVHKDKHSTWASDEQRKYHIQLHISTQCAHDTHTHTQTLHFIYLFINLSIGSMMNRTKHKSNQIKLKHDQFAQIPFVVQINAQNNLLSLSN